MATTLVAPKRTGLQMAEMMAEPTLMGTPMVGLNQMEPESDLMKEHLKVPVYLWGNWMVHLMVPECWWGRMMGQHWELQCL